MKIYVSNQVSLKGMDSNLLEEKIYSIDEKKTRIAIMSVMILSLLGRRFCLSLENLGQWKKK